MHTRIALLALLLAAAAQAADAQSLRERIAERRAAGQQNEMLEDEYARAGPASLPPGAQLLGDVRYGADRRQAMDVYLPKQARNAPMILMVHGGGWRNGNKAMRSVTANKLARWVQRGFVFISVNYRMLPEADPLRQAEDVARALAFAQSRAGSWGGDPAKFVLMGHSAGAHLVALLSADPSKALALGAKPWLGTVALDSAAFDVAAIMAARHLPLYDRAFGKDEASWRRASPLHMLTSSATPLLGVCSTRRREACPQAEGYAAKAKHLGVRAEVLPQDLSHRQINDELGLPGAYTEAVESFLVSLGAH